MRKIKYQKLLKLADHLESGKLGHKKFDFSVINDDTKYLHDDKYERKITEGFCGSAGCALGECPIVFPKDWKFYEIHDGSMVEGGVGLKNLKMQRDNWAWVYTKKSAMKFFGLREDEAIHLFVPDSQEPQKYGGIYLLERATKKQVASNIREFVKVMKPKKKKNTKV